MPETRRNGLWRARVICHPIWENGCAPFNCLAARSLSASFYRRILRELETLTCKQAMNFARFLANVLGKLMLVRWTQTLDQNGPRN